MSNRYVNVEISRETKAISLAGSGLSLILSTEKVSAYKEYTKLEAIGVDYGATSETYKIASAILGQTPRPRKVAIYGTLYEGLGVPQDLIDELDTLVKTHGDFLFLHCTEQSDDVITAISNWNATKERFYFASTSNELLHVALTDNENTVLLVHPNPETYPAAAWVGVCSPMEVGGYTWTFKTLNGIEPASYDDDELNGIEDGASSYIREAGVNITSKGITTSGEYIDIIQGQYFLKSRITEAVFALLARMPKVSFRNGGIGLVVAEIETVLKRGANQGVIAKTDDGQPLYSITAPDVNDISHNDKANRVLPDLNWEATIDGAVEKVKINGVLKI